MVTDNKKAKAGSAPKSEVVAKDKKTVAADKKAAVSDVDKVESKAEAQADIGEPAAAPSNYSRGEGQKPVTAAYKENWNAIFGKKGKKKKR